MSVENPSSQPYKTSALNNIRYILLSVLLVVNLSISLDHLVDREQDTNVPKVELALSKSTFKDDTVHFDQVQGFCSTSLPAQNSGQLKLSPYRIKQACLQHKLSFSTQMLTNLDLKPNLLQIRLNTISIQKAHLLG